MAEAAGLAREVTVNGYDGSMAAISFLQATPNPTMAGNSTTIRYQLGRSANVQLVIYDVQGRRVRELLAGPQGAGIHTEHWNGLDSSGQRVASGVYYYRLSTSEQTETRKIALSELADLEAAACCGTAAVLTWIKRIANGDQAWEFPFDERWQQLYDTLVGIQTARRDDPRRGRAG